MGTAEKYTGIVDGYPAKWDRLEDSSLKTLCLGLGQNSAIPQYN